MAIPFHRVGGLIEQQVKNSLLFMLAISVRIAQKTRQACWNNLRLSVKFCAVEPFARRTKSAQQYQIVNSMDLRREKTKSSSS